MKKEELLNGMREILIGKEENGIKVRIYDNGNLKLREIFTIDGIDREIFMTSEESNILKNLLNRHLK